MKFAVISDLHANLEALTSVLRAIDRMPVDRIVCLGDIVGYHANPNECIVLLEAARAICIAGNHDRAAIGRKDTARFGSKARSAIAWTKTVLSDRSREFLSKLPLSRQVSTDDDDASAAGLETFFCVHAALHPEPNDDIHLSSDEKIACSLELLAQGRFGARLCFFGHTHRAIIHAHTGQDWHSMTPDACNLDAERYHYLVNPGSVGQPRDSDGRAAFLIFDSKSGALEFHRTPYDERACMAKVERHGLWQDPTPLTRSADWLFDKLDTGRSAALRVARAFR
jgi:predicted phosphodiesterase